LLATRIEQRSSVLSTASPSGCAGGLNGDGSAYYEGLCEQAEQDAYDAARAAEALREMEELAAELFEREAREAYEKYQENMREDYIDARYPDR
jgi:hypothetical protein